jgi:hypothetical protein
MTIPTLSQDYHLYHDDLPASVVRKDYHRFYLDPQTLPSPRIVGVLACQRDPYLRSLDTRILRAEPAGEEAVARSRGVTAQTANGQPVKGDGKGKDKEKGKGKAGKGNKSDGVAGKNTGVPSGDKKEEKNVKTGETELWQLELEDTVLFPEGKSQRFHLAPFSAGLLCSCSSSSLVWSYLFSLGGGQPNDTGILEFSSPMTDGRLVRLVIQDVFRRGLTALHIVRLPAEDRPEERENALKALQAVGNGGGEATCTVTVDWERRYDQVRLSPSVTEAHYLQADTPCHLVFFCAALHCLTDRRHSIQLSTSSPPSPTPTSNYPLSPGSCPHTLLQNHATSNYRGPSHRPKRARWRNDAISSLLGTGERTRKGRMCACGLRVGCRNVALCQSRRQVLRDRYPERRARNMRRRRPPSPLWGRKKLKGSVCLEGFKREDLMHTMKSKKNGRIESPVVCPRIMQGYVFWHFGFARGETDGASVGMYRVSFGPR